MKPARFDNAVIKGLTGGPTAANILYYGLFFNTRPDRYLTGNRYGSLPGLPLLLFKPLIKVHHKFYFNISRFIRPASYSGCNNLFNSSSVLSFYGRTGSAACT